MRERNSIAVKPGTTRRRVVTGGIGLGATIFVPAPWQTWSLRPKQLNTWRTRARSHESW